VSLAPGEKSLRRGHEKMLEYRREMVMACGSMSQMLGHPKSVGQIYGYLFFSLDPLSLDEIAQQLGVSKGSVSSGVRILLNWGLVRQVWIQGDRKEFVEVVADEGTIFKSGMSDFVKPRLEAAQRRLERTESLLEEAKENKTLTEEEHKGAIGRLEKLKRLQERGRKIVSLIETFAR